VGAVANKHPRLVKLIDHLGFEIASHGYSHRLVYQQSKEQFRNDVHRSKVVLEDLTGKKLLGYRAPSWSMDTSRTPWAWDILHEAGFEYSSSVFPIRTFLYGDEKASRIPYRQPAGNGGSIWEIPPAVHKISVLRLPFGGGFYFRLLPLSITCHLLKAANLGGQPVVMYFHPHEMNPVRPNKKLGMRDHFITYWNFSNNSLKLEKLLKMYTFDSVQNIFNLRPGLVP
jgi:polysaccharide deacetylase family protein (PEP-CTERM system associated)